MQLQSAMSPYGPAFRKRTKHDICETYLTALALSKEVDVDVPGFKELLKQHFDRLPTRYALDVNLDSLDVLSHQRLLEEARGDPHSVSFAVRPVEVIVHGSKAASPAVRINRIIVFASSSLLFFLHMQGGASSRVGTLPKPAFGSSPNLQVCLQLPTGCQTCFACLMK